MDGEIFDVKIQLIKQMICSLTSITLSFGAAVLSVCSAISGEEQKTEAALSDDKAAVTVSAEEIMAENSETVTVMREPRPKITPARTSTPVAEDEIAEETTEDTTTEATAEATTTEETTTEETTEPEPLWTEEEVSGVKYVNTDGIYSRIAALLGSARVKQYALNDTVNVIAKTDTDYFKLEDGTFIHADYLSDSFVEVTTTTTAHTEPPAADAQVQDKAWEMFRLVNEYRVQNGLAPFQWDYNAYPAAKIRANELLYYNSHIRPNGTRYSTVYDEIGYKPSSSAENIVYYYSSASSALNSLISSPSHRVLILNPKLTHIAIAYVYDPNSYWGYYWVQELTAP